MTCRAFLSAAALFAALLLLPGCPASIAEAPLASDAGVLPVESDCANAADDEADGFVDCRDLDCDRIGPCEFAKEITCDDGIDNDEDGARDCFDDDCTGCAATCGEGLCTGAETCASCVDDCGSCPPYCGDDQCNGTEGCTNCPADCGECPAGCGDKACAGTEDCASCPGDCGACAARCGDGRCNGDETCTSCVGDCGACAATCGDATCAPTESCVDCPGDCGACPTVCGDARCNGTETCLNCELDCGACPVTCGDARCVAGETCVTCAGDCGACPANCGDRACNGGETCATCAADCGACPPRCGDGSCNGTELCSTCAADCGACPPTCGDESCASPENCATCALDCGTCPPRCGDGSCNGVETCSDCRADCGVCPTCGDDSCNGVETCSTCTSDCGPCATCGDTVCNGGDTCANCAADCGACPTSCGDGACSGGETCSSCAADCGACSTTETLVPAGGTWRYLDDGSNQGTAWRAVTFDDAAWKSGMAQLGYGESDQATVVSYGPNASAKYITTWFRLSFQIPNPTVYSRLALRLLVDDGAVVYLNGTEAVRASLPTGTITYTTRASNATCENCWNEYPIEASLLRDGKNVLAVEVHQASLTSSDLSFDAELKATRSGSACGDAVCGLAETCTSCAADCGPCTAGCGDNTCASTESCTSCPADCGACPPRCGDGTCNSTETCTSCVADCGACAPRCGDGTCNGTETCLTCAGDCGTCPAGCPDGTCNGTETCSTCAADCGACATCGDTVCGAGETCTSCPGDCGSCTTGFRFVSWADTKSGTATLAALSNQAKALKPAFTIYNGDLESDGFTLAGATAWKTAVNGNSSNGMFDILFPVRGNHETHVNDTPGWQAFFDTAGVATRIGATHFSAKESELTYSFDYKNAHFVGVDCTGSAANVDAAEIAWIDSDLAAAASRGITHAFLFMHGPLWPVGDHCCTVNTSLTQMLNKHPILSATFHGHEHVNAYVHITSARISNVTRPIEQFITGAAGAGPGTCTSTRVDYCMAAYGFASIDVSGKSFTVNLYKRGVATVEKSWTFTKP